MVQIFNNYVTWPTRESENFAVLDNTVRLTTSFVHCFKCIVYKDDAIGLEYGTVGTLFSLLHQCSFQHLFDVRRDMVFGGA